MNQERKAQLAPGIKAVLKKYGIKASIAVHHYSTLVVNIKSGAIDFISNFNEVCGREGHRSFHPAIDHISVNEFWFHEHFDGDARNFLKELIDAMNVGNHDNSDIQSDYFDIGWHLDINIGKWNKPYTLE
jgi:hypothetical protein